MNWFELVLWCLVMAAEQSDWKKREFKSWMNEWREGSIWVLEQIKVVWFVHSGIMDNNNHNNHIII